MHRCQSIVNAFIFPGSRNNTNKRALCLLEHLGLLVGLAVTFASISRSHPIAIAAGCISCIGVTLRCVAVAHSRIDLILVSWYLLMLSIPVLLHFLLLIPNVTVQIGFYWVLMDYALLRNTIRTIFMSVLVTIEVVVIVSFDSLKAWDKGLLCTATSVVPFALCLVTMAVSSQQNGDTSEKMTEYHEILGIFFDKVSAFDFTALAPVDPFLRNLDDVMEMLHAMKACIPANMGVFRDSQDEGKQIPTIISTVASKIEKNRTSYVKDKSSLAVEESTTTRVEPVQPEIGIQHKMCTVMAVALPHMWHPERGSTTDCAGAVWPSVYSIIDQCANEYKGSLIGVWNGDTVMLAFLGSGAMAFSCSCALAIVDFLEKQRSSGDPHAASRVRLGIASGKVFLGSLHAKTNTSTLLCGPCVSLALQLASFAEGSTPVILVDEDVQENCQYDFIFAPADVMAAQAWQVPQKKLSRPSNERKVFVNYRTRVQEHPPIPLVVYELCGEREERQLEEWMYQLQVENEKDRFAKPIAEFSNLLRKLANGDAKVPSQECERIIKGLDDPKMFVSQAFLTNNDVPQCAHPSSTLPGVPICLSKRRDDNCVLVNQSRNHKTSSREYCRRLGERLNRILEDRSVNSLSSVNPLSEQARFQICKTTQFYYSRTQHNDFVFTIRGME